MTFFSTLAEKHAALKAKIHAARFPLPVYGQRIMGTIYFTLPLIAGYNIMLWTINRSDEYLEDQV